LLLPDTASGRDVVRGNVLAQMRELPILPCPAAAIQAFEHGEGRSISHPKKLEFLDAWNYRERFNLLGFRQRVLPVSRILPRLSGKKNRFGEF
jgi:hypothetical protein